MGIPKSADELRRMILSRMMNEPVCPEGMDVRIQAQGASWTIDCIPPAGGIAYADCCKFANRIAAELRGKYSLVLEAE